MNEQKVETSDGGMADGLLAQAELIEGDAKAMMEDAAAKKAKAYEWVIVNAAKTISQRS